MNGGAASVQKRAALTSRPLIRDDFTGSSGLLLKKLPAVHSCLPRRHTKFAALCNLAKGGIRWRSVCAWWRFLPQS